jgi:hypothetical protein
VASQVEPTVEAPTGIRTPNSANEEDNTMASLYVWKGNGATVCRFHRTPSDWEYEPLSAIETLAFVRMLKAEDLARTSPWSPATWDTGGGGRMVL